MLKITNIKNHISENRALYIIFLVALVFRVIGISHGYPYIFNIDEPALVRSTFGLRQGFRIDHFDWPHFSYYFNYAFYFVFIKIRALAQMIGLKQSIEGAFPILWNDPFVFYFISRFISALMGALSIVPIYRLGSAIFNRKIGVLSAAIFAVLPYHIYMSKFALADTTLLFFVAYAIYYSYRFSETLKVKDIIIAAIMYGIASGIKYNAILLAITLVLFVAMRLITKKELTANVVFKNIIPKFALFGIVSLLVLLITTPSIIFDWDVFWSYKPGRGFLWQLFLNSSPLESEKYFPYLINRLKMITLDFGVIPFVLFLYSLFLLIRNKTTDNKQRLSGVVMALSIILFILFTNKYARATSHYFVAIYGLVSILAAWGLSYISDKIKNKLLIYSTFVVLSLWSIYTVSIFIKADTRNIALKYYEKAREEDVKIYYEGGDLGDMKSINNLDMKDYNEGSVLQMNDILISEKKLENDDKIMIIENIDNSFRKGPNIYVYKKSI